jgi:hypothetical protein
MVSIKLGLYIYIHNQIIDVQNHRFLLLYTGTQYDFYVIFLIIFVTRFVNFYRRKRYFFNFREYFFLKKSILNYPILKGKKGLNIPS